MNNASVITNNVTLRGSIIAVICLLLIPLMAAAAPVGKVTRVEGQVDVLKTGKQAVTKVAQGDDVEAGDIFRTKTASRAEITFHNKNVLKIDPATRVEINQYSMNGDKINQIMKLQRGKVQAISGEEFMKKISSAVEGNKLEVHTPNAVAGIRGSHMVVNFSRVTTALYFRTGKGYFYNPRFPERIVNITGGLVSSITGMNGLPTTPRPGNDAYPGENGSIPALEDRTQGTSVLTRDASSNVPDLLKQQPVYVPVEIGSGVISEPPPLPPEPPPLNSPPSP